MIDTALTGRVVVDGHVGHVWSRTGRAFFADGDRRKVLERLSEAASRSLFETLQTDWLLLDCEVMPWNGKATDLIEQQFAPTGRAAMISTEATLDALRRFSGRGVADMAAERMRLEERLGNARAFDKVWRGYCHPVEDVTDVRLAPFHVLASEGRVHHDVAHVQHLAWIESLASAADGLRFDSTSWLVVDLDDPGSVAKATRHWLDRTASGAEGVVVKPPLFLTRGSKGRFLQPALKVRGVDYLRIIYGPDYDLPENLSRLRDRAIGPKRQQAALGLEGLARFVQGAPLRDVHECVFATLALGMEAMDPRL